MNSQVGVYHYNFSHILKSQAGEHRELVKVIFFFLEISKSQSDHVNECRGSGSFNMYDAEKQDLSQSLSHKSQH